ncbi:MAG: acyl-CoA thioesterase [Gemmatimonadaceae bacterium]
MRFPLAVRYADYDTKGHINNAVYLTYFEIARSHAWLHAMRQGTDPPFILAEATVRYVSQARVAEDLDIEITTSEIRTKAWVWAYVIRATTDDRIVAEGSTVQVMFDYETRRTIPIPDDLRGLLTAV